MKAGAPLLPRKRRLAGYTLMEMLVVLGVLTLLTALLIGYSRIGEQRLDLFRAQARIASTVFRAKSLTLQTFVGEGRTCGYGVHLDTVNNRAILFSDPRITDDCATSDHRYSGAGEEVAVILLAEDGVAFDAGTNITDVFFQPPEPKTFFTPDPASAEGVIVLVDPETGAQLSIFISRAGRIATQ